MASTSVLLGPRATLPAGDSRALEDLRLPNYASFVPEVRSLARIVGMQPLGELQALGRRLDDDSRLARLLAQPGDILVPEKLSALAPLVPDLAIALDAYNNTFARFVRDEHRAPCAESSAVLGHLARRLARLDSSEFADLVEMCKSDDASTVEPTWAALSKGVISRFTTAQLEAYRLRLSLQPDGANVLSTTQPEKESQYTRDMRHVLGPLLLEELRPLGSEGLSYVRLIGRALGRDMQAPEVESLHRAPLLSMRNANGIEICPSSSLSHFLAEAHHRAWLKARDIVAGTRAPSASGHNARNSSGPLGELPQYFRNLNYLNAFALAAEVGRLSDPDFEELQRVSHKTDTVTVRERLRLRAASPVGAVSDDAPSLVYSKSEPLPVTVEWKPALSRPELVKSFERWINAAEEHLKHRESSAILAAVATSDSMTGTTNAPEFRELATAVRAIHDARSRLLERTWLAVASLPAEQVAAIVAREPLTFDGADGLRADDASQIRRLLLAHQERYSEISVPAESMHRTERVGTTELEPVIPAVRALVEQATGRYGTSDYSTNGGVIFDCYNADFLERYVEGGNYLVVQRSSERPDAVDGFILFGHPDNAQQELGEFGIPKFPGSVSVAELIVVSPSRPPGTYNRLVNSMCIHLNAVGTDLSVGFSNSQNARQRDALIHVGHRKLELFSVTSSLNDTDRTEHESMILVVNPGLDAPDRETR